MGFETLGFSELERELEELGNQDEIAPIMLEAAAPILEKELKGQINKETNKGYANGDLARAIKANKPGKNERGYYVSVSARGKDRKGVQNKEKLAYLNFGTSKQGARPVIANSIKRAEKPCLDIMQEKFNEVTGG